MGHGDYDSTSNHNYWHCHEIRWDVMAIYFHLLSNLCRPFANIFLKLIDLNSTGVHYWRKIDWVDYNLFGPEMIQMLHFIALSCHVKYSQHHGFILLIIENKTWFFLTFGIKFIWRRKKGVAPEHQFGKIWQSNKAHRHIYNSSASSPAFSDSNSPADIITGSTPIALNIRSVWNVFPWPFPPQIPA